jgi:alkyl sulfatase BDS1-like metallo-beta-lactamase superfamily hydrolase
VRGKGLLRAMTIEQLWDSISVRLKSEEVGGIEAAINWTFTDLNEKWVLGLSNRTLYTVRGRHESTAAVSVTLTKLLLVEIVTQQTTFMDEIQKGNIAIEGDPAAMLTIFGNLDQFVGGWGIVEP